MERRGEVGSDPTLDGEPCDDEPHERPGDGGHRPSQQDPCRHAQREGKRGVPDRGDAMDTEVRRVGPVPVRRVEGAHPPVGHPGERYSDRRGGEPDQPELHRQPAPSGDALGPSEPEGSGFELTCNERCAEEDPDEGGRDRDEERQEALQRFVELDSLRTACRDAVDAGRNQAQLIDALLTLARSQRGLDRREIVDLTAIVNDVLDAHRSAATTRRLRIDTTLDDATVLGDGRLISILVSNLADNAIRYNLTGGRVEVCLAAGDLGATLIVANAGPPIPPEQVDRLLRPFQRAARDRTITSDGFGLGLSIVADIAKAHGPDFEISAPSAGGLTIVVTFPTCAPSDADGDSHTREAEIGTQSEVVPSFLP